MAVFLLFILTNFLTCRNSGVPLSVSVQLCSWCFLCPRLHLSPCLTSLVLHWEWDRDQRLTQLLLISLVVHNSVSLSLCPVNEDADVIGLPAPPLLCSVGTFPPLSQGSMLLLHFLWSCVTARSGRVALHPPSPLPQAGWSLWETVAQKTDLHFSILERLRSLRAKLDSPKESVWPYKTQRTALDKGLEPQSVYFIIYWVFWLSAALNVIHHWGTHRCLNTEIHRM